MSSKKPSISVGMHYRTGLLSHILRLRCPRCGTIQPCLPLIRTGSRFSKLKAHECGQCFNLLELINGDDINEVIERMSLPLFLLYSVGLVAFGCAYLFVFLTSGYYAFEYFREIPGLSYFHEGRGSREPNFIGFVLGNLLFTVPSIIVFLGTPNLIFRRFTSKVVVSNSWRT